MYAPESYRAAWAHYVGQPEAWTHYASGHEDYGRACGWTTAGELPYHGDGALEEDTEYFQGLDDAGQTGWDY